ncbi:MAG: LamG domain-containing protein [Bacteroidales bacterium]|nr:LamG domain-containing protein [Bacteroidales bacterium]
MKILKYFGIPLLLMVMMAACEKGIDPINAVAPGTDETAPTLNITFPVQGKPVTSMDEVATVYFKMLAVDDIEIGSVKIELDGTTIGNLTSFKDYRRADISFKYETLVDGDHVLIVTVTDLTGKTISKTMNFKKITVPPYTPMAGEVFYMPFDDNFLNIISGSEVPVTGAPGFAEGKKGSAYAGATDSYITYPTSGIVGSTFSLAFWYKINATPLRAGMISISPIGDSRNTGLRLFRENNGDNQNIGLNIGIGTTEVWMNPITTVPANQDWMHIAISISEANASIYVNGSVVLEQALDAPIDWTGCSSITIGSGMPNFVYWEHFSDLSLYDELKFFTKAISAEEVTTIYTMK